ncbi:hypothetical protein ES703_27775 [subsurface metagenome]
MIADTLSTGAGTVFTGDDDPELIKEALPFALKLYESLLEQTPENKALLLSTGSGFVMYANAFIQTPAGMLPYTEFEKQERMLKRASRLYLRGRGYVLRALELSHPGFNALLENDQIDQALELTAEEDVAYLFWAAAAWMGAFSADTFDIELLISVPKAAAMMKHALELDESFEHGAIHEFFISYYGSVPEAMGGSEEKARYHFQKALEYSGGLSASPYIALAATISVKNQDMDEYRELLERALAIDPDSSLENKLANILNQRKAQWMLEHIEDYFLLAEEGGATE